MSMIDWPRLKSHLDEAIKSSETDAFIENKILTALPSDSSTALPTLISALEVAKSVFVKGRISIAISLTAPSDDSDSVSALMKIIEESRHHDIFLYSRILKAMGCLAKHNHLAHAQISLILLQLQPTDSPFLLIQAAKVIGQLESHRKTMGFREILEKLSRADDLSVQSEAFQQRALLALTDALLQNNLFDLRRSLQEVYISFQKAKASEENRDDATVFVLLIDLLLEIFNIGSSNHNAVARTIAKKEESLREFINNPCRDSLRLDFEQLLMIRVLDIASSCRRISESTSNSEEWTNFDDALVNLASVCVLLKAKKEIEMIDLDKAFENIFPNIFVPKLGPILKRAVGRARFKKVIDNYLASKGEDSLSQGLRYIYDSAIENEYSELESNSINNSTLGNLRKEIEKRGEDPDFFLTDLTEALAKGDTETWLKKYDFQVNTLSIDHPELFGNDPQVDEAVRNLLIGIRERLRDYHDNKWSRLIKVCETIAVVVHQIRNELPPYCLSDQAPSGKKGGKGQHADEHDLQNDLIRYLKSFFGNHVSYEPTRIAGGRSDLSISFEDCEFPIEVKAEYRCVSRTHIHERYIAQPDTYASVRDRISFLMVLDLRDSNSGQTVKQRAYKQKPDAQKTSKNASTYSLYSLRESFYVDGLSVDPQISDAQSKAVVVCLVPGNRPRPSWLTNYSRKPSKSAYNFG